MKSRANQKVAAALLVLLLFCGIGLYLLFFASGRIAGEVPAQPNVEKPVTIRFTWWGDENRAEKTRQVIRIFEEQHPEIRVQTSYFPFDFYYDNLLIASEINNMPDVFIGFVGSDNDFIINGVLEPLQEYVDAGIIKTGDISEPILESGKHEGVLYGLSVGINVKCLVVDRSAFAKAGIKIPEIAYASWDEVIEDLSALKEVTEAYGADDLFSRRFTFDYYLRQCGESMYSGKADPLLGFSKKTYMDYYDRKKSMIEQGLVPPYDVSEKTTDILSSQLVRGKSAMKFCYSNEFVKLEEASGRELELLLLPGPNTDKGTDIRPGSHILMSAQSKHKEEAGKLIDFMINDLEANRIMNGERGLPASMAVREALMPDYDKHHQKVLRILELAEANSSPAGPMAPVDTKVFCELLRTLEEDIFYGGLPPAEAYDVLAETFGSIR